MSINFVDRSQRANHYTIPPLHYTIMMVVVKTNPLYGSMKAWSKAGLAVVAGRVAADVDGHGQVKLGQLTSRVTFDRPAAVHWQTTQLVDTEHRHAIPRVEVHAHVTPVYNETNCIA